MKTRKKIRKELNNYELSRTKDFPETQKNQLNYPNFQETQTRPLTDSAKTKKIFFFFFLRQQSRFQDQASFYIYIYILARTKQNQELRCVCRF